VRRVPPSIASDAQSGCRRAEGWRAAAAPRAGGDRAAIGWVASARPGRWRLGGSFWIVELLSSCSSQLLHNERVKWRGTPRTRCDSHGCAHGAHCGCRVVRIGPRAQQQHAVHATASIHASTSSGRRPTRWRSVQEECGALCSVFVCSCAMRHSQREGGAEAHGRCCPKDNTQSTAGRRNQREGGAEAHADGVVRIY
jgi:hypothetical protein